MAFIPKYVLILVVLIVVDYIAGIFIHKSKGKRRKLYLFISIVSNLTFLGFFKYYNFFITNAHLPFGLLNLVLPIGLSFHTFQAMSYTIEVYRKKVKPEKNLLIYALYVMFYPQLVAGPIERPQNLLPQFHIDHKFEYTRVVEGLRLMMWGMFKKVVVADRLALYVSTIYDKPHDYYGISLILATIFFAFQIYCDFSGYSDIAIGAAKVMGFNLMKNFNFPYFSKNISEFWQRWHISLSSWFRDYVYIPLGGSRVKKVYWVRNIYIVFVLSGFWHGASWTFIIWGALHGAYYLFFNRFPKLANRFTTFILVCFAWVFFRANNLNDAIYIVTHLTYGTGGYIDFISHLLPKLINHTATEFNMMQLLLPFTVGLEYLTIKLLWIFFVVLILIDLVCARKLPISDLSRKSIYVRWTIYIVCILIIMNLGVASDLPFIYFQF